MALDIINRFRRREAAAGAGTSNNAAERPAEGKASATAALVAFESAGRAAWTPGDAASLVQAGFADNPIAHRAARLVAEAAADLPLVVGDGEVRWAAHPVIELLERPNADEGRADFLEALFLQLILTGDAYLEAVPGAAPGLPQELHVLRSDRMAVVVGKDGWPEAYEYRIGGRKLRFPAGEPGGGPICHLRLVHPRNDHYGFSPLKAAGRSVDVHNATSAWAKALLDNAARPSGAIVYRGADGQGSLSPDQYRRLVEELEANHQGTRNAGRPMLLEGGLDWKPMGFSPQEMEFLRTREVAAREIALAFGVPPMLLGLPGDNTYANYREAGRAFFRLTVLPLARRVFGRLGNWLAALGGERVVIVPDLDRVPALAEERDALWQRVATADFLDADEKRALLGLPPRGAGKAETGSGEDVR